MYIAYMAGCPARQTAKTYARQQLCTRYTDTFNKFLGRKVRVIFESVSRWAYNIEIIVLQGRMPRKRDSRCVSHQLINAC